ncbi:glycerophosphodiester phosphodiesterase family protein [Jannaschia seohaensis]|uniref:Glycerophosphoryl diester phosphodiesterase n=1 Tax=Jannaschia seohaensis TaxID=475081 RepID=A0A2Y9A6G1_9RHOB|nr:glycerophosphodiester phosphodiesterase family protein [Jannaschia seohaensis]PWJ21911.1 glycerophosphoryl diester phosphodiesterase [Jannaschia seohaensis]SSA38189.1 Glycerophosphoryl diester phosphodiesterase [Jannaschia seohaensis]
MIPLPASFLKGHLAHRGLHDREKGRPENSLAAFRAAIELGVGIELDVQRSADGVAMAFHDYKLERLTGRAGQIADLDAAALAEVPLLGGDEGVPTLAQALAEIAGRVPVLIEVKDQDGAMGPNVGPLEDAVLAALDGYEGDVALMSFNPHSVAHMATKAPHLPRGLTTSAFDAEDWPDLPAETRERLARIPDLDRVGAAFISHQGDALTMPRVAEIKAQGLPILCWTIRSKEQERIARTVADAVTFEGYLP